MESFLTTIGLVDFLGNKEMRTVRVPSITWLTNFMQNNNRSGVRVLALIKGERV